MPRRVSAQDLRNEGKEAGSLGVEIHQVRPLLDRDHERETESIAAQHGARDQVRERAEAQCGCEHERGTRAGHQNRGEREAQREIASSESERRGSEHRGGG